MGLFKKKQTKRLEEELDNCEYIKGCKFKEPGILYSCEDGAYTGCSIYLGRKEKEKEEGKRNS